MDCEKYEPLLLDELYEELDEVTSAAVKRHVTGCAKCAGVLNGFKSTRRAATLPLVALPAGLEDRILAAAREAQKVVPIKSRGSRALSWASSWAMRPQTAMAAVFLLMIGSGAFLIRSRTYESSRAASVSGYGTPAPAEPAATSSVAALDNKAADTAHGPTPAPPAVMTPPPPAASAFTQGGDTSLGLMDGITGGVAKEKPGGDDEAAFGALGQAAGSGNAVNERKKDEAEARRPAKSEPATPAPGNAGAPAGAPDYGGSQSAAPQPNARSGPAGRDPFSLGVAAYQARNYAEAIRQFDAAAQSGDQNAALWAAKSAREGSGGCAVALGRFDQLSQKASGTWHGNEASLEAARCLVAMGQIDKARLRLAALQQSSTHAKAAQAVLDEANQIAARRASGGGGGEHASGASAPKPRAAAAPPAAAPAPTGGHHGSGKAAEKKPADLEQRGAGY